jgi:CBS domain-containing protein
VDEDFLRLAERKPRGRGSSPGPPRRKDWRAFTFLARVSPSFDACSAAAVCGECECSIGTLDVGRNMVPGIPAEGRFAMSERLNAGDICNRIVTVADRCMSVVEAAQLMRSNHVGCLVVLEEWRGARRAVGLLTDRDIVTAVVAKEVDPKTLCVEDVMGTDVVTALESDSMADMLGAMRRKGLRRLPVTGNDGQFVGLVTLDDLLEIQAEQLKAVVMTIEAEQRREHVRRP